RVAYVHEHKTGDLIACACAMGATAAGAGAAAAAEAGKFGLALGRAFQIVDDLLDADDPEKAGELSVLRVLAPGEAREEAKKQTREALDALDRLASGGARSTAAAALLRSLALDQLSRTV
ncbi:MAG: polyprenyl synthetase family protein, partial [Kiritimatiellae bacterium]|nr:polyprenyl synthetase family protein [Kiritimatiellia bacterium]